MSYHSGETRSCPSSQLGECELPQSTNPSISIQRRLVIERSGTESVDLREQLNNKRDIDAKYTVQEITKLQNEVEQLRQERILSQKGIKLRDEFPEAEKDLPLQPFNGRRCASIKYSILKLTTRSAVDLGYFIM